MKLKNFIGALVAAVISFSMLTPAAHAAGLAKFEKVASVSANAPSSDPTDSVSDNEKVDVQIREGQWVYITTSKPLNIKVVTILGSPVAQETLQPGTYRLKITTKGIYILKTGTQTRRIVI